MRNRKSINYETVKALFEANGDRELGDSYFEVRGGGTSVLVAVPTSIMHRLFRLGQAYGIRQLRYLESEVKMIVGTDDLPAFAKDLRKLLSLVNDEVLHEYVNALLAALDPDAGLSFKSVYVSTGDYFKRHA
jgi:hypothetical protein